MQLQSPLMPVYSYEFDYKTTYGYGEYLSNRSYVTGVSHGEDIVLIYESSLRTNHPYTVEEINVMTILLDMYESFAYTNIPKLGALEMQPIRSSNNITYTLIKSASNLQTVYESDINRISSKLFWEDIDKKLITASSGISQLIGPNIIYILLFYYLSSMLISSFTQIL